MLCKKKTWSPRDQLLKLDLFCQETLQTEWTHPHTYISKQHFLEMLLSIQKELSSITQCIEIFWYI